ncbi:MAG: hypothetical protein ACI9VR_000527 [Cognaticolwellia sp.]|jgi:hypothetical protein
MPHRNSPEEEEYFARLDTEKKAALRKRLNAEHAAQAAQERKERHFNHCGKCGGPMAPKLFKGVEIDVCADCGSVLLDPGELEQLAGEESHGLENLVVFFGLSKDD